MNADDVEAISGVTSGAGYLPRFLLPAPNRRVSGAYLQRVRRVDSPPNNPP
jgi:hypothetical protein